MNSHTDIRNYQGHTLLGYMNILFFFILSNCFFISNSSNPEQLSDIDKEICLSENESNLAEMINQYRLENGLTPIPISSSLTLVAKEHVSDLIINKPYDDQNICNPHSWSKEGSWESCCYNSGKDGECMWNKPRELTDYQADGYEIIMGQFNSQFPTEEVSAESAIRSWKESPNHNAIIINKNIWKKTDWNAMGIGIYQGFAAVWFGEEIDPNGSPQTCP